MPIIPKFRTFVNELGVSPNISLTSNKYRCFISPVIVNAQTYMQLYWRFYRLIIEYKYTINDRPISRTFVVTDNEPNYKNRIDATWEICEQRSDLSLLNFQFALAFPASPFSDKPMDDDYFEERSKMFITASRHAQRIDPNTKIYLCFWFEEVANNADFHFDNYDPKFGIDPGRCKILHTLTTNFLGSPQTFYLYTSRSTVQGYINYVKITHELYDIPNENS